MSANPTPAPPTPPTSPTAQAVDAVTDALAWGLSIAFPALAPTFAAGNKVLDQLAPWIVSVVEKKTLDMATLKSMQADLNSLGPSFPAAGGYSNAFAGGAGAAPGTNPAQATANSATIIIKGSPVTITAATLEGLLSIIQALTTKSA